MTPRERHLARYLEGCVGTTVSALIEKPGLGRSEQFAPVAIDGPIGTGGSFSIS